MAKAAKKAKVKIVTGDTKVVPQGKADKIIVRHDPRHGSFPVKNVCKANLYATYSDARQ